jgi:uncharacterized phage protein (TIGR02218 family)
MKSATPDLIAWLAANRTCYRADLLTIVLKNGVTVRWTTAPITVTLDGHTWVPAGGETSALYQRSNLSQSCGLQVDTLDLTLLGPLWVNGTGFNRIGAGQALGAAATTGYFDGAKVTIDHLIMAEPGNLTRGKVNGVFVGKVADPAAEGVDLVLRCKSFISELQQPLPKFVLQPQCGNQVYDYNCKLTRASWLDTGTVLDAPDRRTITTDSAAIVGRAINWYSLAVLTFDRTGESVQLVHDDAPPVGGVRTFTLAGPTQFVYATGDTFKVAPGCSKSLVRCGFFSNTANFRGFLHVPKPESESST